MQKPVTGQMPLKKLGNHPLKDESTRVKEGVLKEKPVSLRKHRDCK